MGIRSSMGKVAGGVAAKAVAPVAAPIVAKQFLDRAINGFPGFPGAVQVAAKASQKTTSVDAAIKKVTDQHVRLAGAEGFATSLGGIVTIAITLPANVAGLALLYVRQAAAIAHLRGYDVHDERVKAAVLASVLGRDGVTKAVGAGLLPGTPYQIANGLGPLGENVARNTARLVTAALTASVTGKHAALVITRRIPVVGGGVGAVVDGYTLWSAAKYVSEEFTPRVAVTSGHGS